MTLKEFSISVKQRLLQHFDDAYHIELREVCKNNDSQLLGVIIRKDNLALAPTIYLESYYEDYITGLKNMDQIIYAIITVYHDALCRVTQPSNFSIELSDVKENITFRLVSRKENRKLLEDTPYIPFLDLAIIFSVIYNVSNQSVDSIRVTNSILDSWHLATKDVFHIAMENTRRIFPEYMEPIQDVLSALVTKEEQDLLELDNRGKQMMIVTNKQKVNGSVVILYPGVLDYIAQEYASDLIIIPSSIHEVLVLPYEESYDLKEMSEMVCSVNETSLAFEEILSDHVYVYLKDTKEFQL